MTKDYPIAVVDGQERVTDYTYLEDGRLMRIHRDFFDRTPGDPTGRILTGHDAEDAERRFREARPEMA